MSETITIAQREVGGGTPCYVIAEVGVNHNGDVRIAHQLIDVAAAAGADAVKFQTFDPALLVAEDAATAPYQTSATGIPSQREMLDALVLPLGAWQELSKHAATTGLHFLSTPFDLPSARLLAELDVPALKVPSGELTNAPFIRSLAAMGLPLLMSTGMGDLAEVGTAVAHAAAAPALALFHCVSAYPAPDDQANLRAIATMQQAFGVPVGWSDHTVGAVTAVASVALGAALLEKHITLDRRMAGPDHAASEDPAAFGAYVADVRRAESALGDGQKRPQPAEAPNREAARRSWHASRDLRPGDEIGPNDVVALRPATGVPPNEDVVGRRVSRHVRAGEPLRHDDVEPRS